MLVNCPSNRTSPEERSAVSEVLPGGGLPQRQCLHAHPKGSRLSGAWTSRAGGCFGANRAHPNGGSQDRRPHPPPREWVLRRMLGDKVHPHHFHFGCLPCAKSDRYPGGWESPGSRASVGPWQRRREHGQQTPAWLFTRQPRIHPPTRAHCRATLPGIRHEPTVICDRRLSADFWFGLVEAWALLAPLHEVAGVGLIPCALAWVGRSSSRRCRVAKFNPTKVLPAPGTPVTKQIIFRRPSMASLTTASIRRPASRGFPGYEPCRRYSERMVRSGRSFPGFQTPMRRRCLIEAPVRQCRDGRTRHLRRERFSRTQCRYAQHESPALPQPTREIPSPLLGSRWVDLLQRL